MGRVSAEGLVNVFARVFVVVALGTRGVEGREAADCREDRDERSLTDGCDTDGSVLADGRFPSARTAGRVAMVPPAD